MNSCPFLHVKIICIRNQGSHGVLHHFTQYFNYIIAALEIRLPIIHVLKTVIVYTCRFALLGTRPNNLSLVCLYLSLYISFLLSEYFFYFDSVSKKKYVQIIKRKYMTYIDTQETDYSV